MINAFLRFDRKEEAGCLSSIEEQAFDMGRFDESWDRSWGEHRFYGCWGKVRMSNIGWWGSLVK